MHPVLAFTFGVIIGACVVLCLAALSGMRDTHDTDDTSYLS